MSDDRVQSPLIFKYALRDSANPVKNRGMVSPTRPEILPLGDTAILVRFATKLDNQANIAAIAFAAALNVLKMPGLGEIAPGLVSVLVQYDPGTLSFSNLAGELRLALGKPAVQSAQDAQNSHQIRVRFGGEAGPDLNEVAKTLGLSPSAFIKAHNSKPLRVLATGFAPGFVYCGMHAAELNLPRRNQVRQRVPAGTVLFAAGQTAITATPIPTGWHVIGHTQFSNFDSDRAPPTILRPGDMLVFTEEGT